MSDEKAETGKSDSDLICLNDHEIQGWSEKLGVSIHELQVAVEKVGPVVEDVRRFLRK
jgi:hypothetical protein